MDEVVKRSNVVWRVTFSAEQDQDLRRKAEQAGMGVCPYIRQQALEGTVTAVDWEALRCHLNAIDGIASDVSAFAQKKIPNRWEYEDDLDALQLEVSKLIALEREILHLIGEQLRSGKQRGQIDGSG